MKFLGLAALLSILALAPMPALAQASNAGEIMANSAKSAADRASEKRLLASKWRKGEKAIAKSNKDIASASKRVTKATKDAAKAQKALDKANKELAAQEKIRALAERRIVEAQQMKREAEEAFRAAFPNIPLS